MANKLLADTIDQRFVELAHIRQPWEELWQKTVELVLPQREFTETWWARHASSHERGIRDERDKIVGRESFDGTGISALQLLADGFQGFIVMRNAAWFRLRVEDPAANEDPVVRRYLDDVELIMYRELARSNFYDAMGEFFLDGGSIGTATIFIEEDKDDNTIVFSPRHPVEIYIAENHHHKIDTVYRKYSMSARQMTMKWSQEQLSKTVWDMVHGLNKTPETLVNVIHGVFPRNNETPGLSKRGSGSRGMRFASVYKEESEPDIISEGGFIDNPYAVWRWAKNSYETYGRSPATNAFVDLSAINQMGKTMIQAAQLSVEPPLNVPSEQRGRVRFVPRGSNYYEEDSSRLITPIVTGINYPVGVDYHDRMKATVREHFKVDFFLLIAQTEKRNLTATEVLELQSEKAAILGATIGRLNSEALDPILIRVYNILKRSNKIPPLPESIANGPGTRLSIDYVGILEQAQERMFRTQGIMRMLQQVEPILQINPRLWNVINDEELMRELVSASGAPAKTLRTREEVAKIEQEMQKRAEQQRALESMGQVADIAQKTSEAPEEGSFADQLQSQLGGGQ